MAELYRYAAFISYSSKDTKFAQRLHRALESYGIPSSLGKFDLIGGGKPNRIYPVFRDREELSAGHLGDQIEANLKASAALIVVCSPNGAASPWVQKEIEFFAAQGRHAKIFAIIPDTAPLTDEQGADCTQSCFPAAFRGDALSGDKLEPLAADARMGKDGFRNAWLKVVAGMIGVSPGQIIDRDKRRRARQAALSVSGALVLALALVFAGAFAASRNLEDRSQTLAMIARGAADAGEFDRAARFAVAALSPGNVLGFPIGTSAAESELRRALSGPLVFGVARAFSITAGDMTGDGSLIALGGADGEVEIRNIAARQAVSLEGQDGYVFDLEFSPDGSRLASAGFGGKARVWDVQTGRLLFTFESHTGHVRSASFSADGRRLVTASSDRTVRTWNADTGQILLVLNGHENEVYDAEFDQSGARIISGSLDGTARIWNANTGVLERILPHGRGRIYSVEFSPDARRVLTATGGRAFVWDLDGGFEPFSLSGHEDALEEAVFSPDGGHIATASLDGTIKIWDAYSGIERYVLRGHSNIVYGVSYSGDGGRLLSVSSDGTARLWAPPLHNAAEVLAYDYQSVSLRPDGAVLAGGLENGEVLLWDIARGTQIGTLAAHRVRVESVTFSPDGSLLATASTDGDTRVWNFLSSTEVAQIEGAVAAFDSRGARVVTGALDGTLRVWAAETGEVRSISLNGGQPIRGVSFNPSGDLILAISANDGAHVVDVNSGQVLRTVNSPDDTLVAAVFHPEGRYIIGATLYQATMLVWNAADGRLLRSWVTPEPVRRFEVSRDGALVLSTSGGSEPGVSATRLWDFASGREIAAPWLTTAWSAFSGFGADERSVLVLGGGEGALYPMPISARLAREQLLENACSGLLSNGLSRMPEAEFDSAPALDSDLDADVCAPPPIWQRLWRIAGFGA